MVAINRIRRKTAVKLVTLTEQQLAHRRAAAWYDRHGHPGAADWHEWQSHFCGVDAKAKERSNG